MLHAKLKQSTQQLIEADSEIKSMRESFQKSTRELKQQHLSQLERYEASLVSHASVAAEQSRKPDDEFDEIDTNHDGVIDRAEYRRARQQQPPRSSGQNMPQSNHATPQRQGSAQIQQQQECVQRHQQQLPVLIHQEKAHLEAQMQEEQILAEVHTQQTRSYNIAVTFNSLRANWQRDRAQQLLDKLILDGTRRPPFTPLG